MSKTRESAGSFTSSFTYVECDEQLWHKRRREVVGIDSEAPVAGIALSGGGIRSATFNAGVLNSLDRHGIMKRMDYLSTVSGGGYVGACYSSLVNRYAKTATPGVPMMEQQVAGEDTNVVGWLRANGKYLISESGFSGWTLGASIMASISLNLLVFLPVILLVFAFMSLDLFAFAWPQSMNFKGEFAISGHDGFSMLLLMGLGCFALYGLLILAYAMVSGFSAFRSSKHLLRVRLWMGNALKSGFVLTAIGLVPVMALLDEAMLSALKVSVLDRVGGHLSYLTPLAGGMLATWRSVKVSNRDGKNTRMMANIGLGLLLYAAAMFAYHLVAHTSLISSTAFLGALSLSLLFGLVCDPNWVSMHSYYRARIAAAFMPHLKSGDASSSFDFPINAMSPYSGAPVHLVNTTLNTSTSGLRKWRSREGASFTLSSLYCGSALTGYKRTGDYMNGRLALSTAVTISGAAVDPNNCLVRSRPVSALMSLLNCRLGYWADNPNLTGARRLGADWFTLVGREVLSVALNERSRHVHLSDGGQFDNLGVYELIRRRCRYIVTSDAGADPTYALGDLARIIDLARADFNATVSIDVEPLLRQQRSQEGFCPCALGTIEYADGSVGEILYLKAMTYEKLPANVYSYAHQNAMFPNESTANQFYGEAQFDAYESLGRGIVDGLLKVCPEQTGIEGLFQAARMLTTGATQNRGSATVERRRPGSPMRAASVTPPGDGSSFRAPASSVDVSRPDDVAAQSLLDTPKLSSSG